MSRTASVKRATKETEVAVALDLDGDAEATAETGLAFFDHMLQQLGKHAGWTLSVTCAGDLEVDGHHTVEDCGLVLGQALKEAEGKVGGAIKVTAFSRFALGEGIEKGPSDFAAEVAAAGGTA